ncbi:hypothetical protein RCL1_000889 [Eukaryota sp. TZLM3-RCL]
MSDTLKRQWELRITFTSKAIRDDTYKGYLENPTVTDIQTPEHFATFLASMTPFKDIPFSTNLLFFQKDLTPDWEHPLLRTGGRMQFQLHNNHALPAAVVQKIFEHTLCLVVGEQFPPEVNEWIAGVYTVIKQGAPRIEIWFFDYSKPYTTIVMDRLLPLFNSLLDEYNKEEVENKRFPVNFTFDESKVLLQSFEERIGRKN